jgi:hypothetical protein
MLARGETRHDLSTARQGGPLRQPAAPDRVNRTALSIHDLDRRRADAGLTIGAVCAAAAMRRDTYHAALKPGAVVKASTLGKIALAIGALRDAAPPARPPSVLAAFIRLAEAELCKRIARDKRLRRDLDSRGTVGSGRVRRLAIYVVAVELQVENAELARALACSRQNIHQARLAVEDWREKPRVDRLLEDARVMVRGTS